MAIMFFVANFGTACYAQAATMLAVRNFPSADRGKVSRAVAVMPHVRFLGTINRRYVARKLQPNTCQQWFGICTVI